METEWEKVSQWYDQIVGKEGHYYHKQVILPNLLPLFRFDAHPEPSLLDLGCGQGFLARAIPKEVNYTGIDLSASLIREAQKQKTPNRLFMVGDICKQLPVKKKDFTHAAIVLALQNVEDPQAALSQAASHLTPGGMIAIVLNHPCFRIPRQSSWVVDPAKKMQSRRIDRYLSPIKIPIQMHPGKGQSSATTWSFHFSLSDYSHFLAKAGFVILSIEEWISDKKSEGRSSKMEDRARAEFPLFLTFLAKKIS